jgi:hypothetical protein
MHRPKLLTLCSFCAISASFGCGSSSDSPASHDAKPAVCEPPGYYIESQAIQIEQVRATLRVPSGEAASGLSVQVCGIDACLPLNADDNGVLNVSPKTMMVRPAFKYGDGFDYAELAAPLTEGQQNLGELIALPLPTLAEGAKFPTNGAVTSGDVTLRLAQNGSVEHDVLSYRDDELVFRSVEVPVAESPRALPPDFGFELAYGLAPLETKFCPPAGLSLKNTLNWAAGTEVEVFVQGLNVDEKWAPYGTWLKVADARVSSDGKSIETTNGGIPSLSSIALRRK